MQRCHTFKVRSTRAWLRVSRTYVRGTWVIKVTLVLLDSECTAHDTHLRTHFSWWPAAVEVEVSIPPKVNQAEVMIERARSTQRCVVHVFCCLTTGILMHASRRASWSRANVQNEKHGLTSMSNSVARSCPRELLQMVLAFIAVWNTKLLRHHAPFSSWPKCLRWFGN